MECLTVGTFDLADSQDYNFRLQYASIFKQKLKEKISLQKKKERNLLHKV